MSRALSRSLPSLCDVGIPSKGGPKVSRHVWHMCEAIGVRL